MGAVASIIHHAVELATWGMNFVNEEPELPSAVQDLIRRLEGKAKVLRWLPNLNRAEFRDFFPERASLSTVTGWRSQVRLRVLEAIGRCNKFHSLDVQDICGGDISRLTASEWEVVLGGFRCGTVLRVIRVEGLTWTSIAEVESFCLQVGRILNTSSVTDLTIGSCRLSTRCLLNLASGLHGNSQSMLKSLVLHNAWEDTSAVKQVADMINSATRLETLEIGGSWDRMYDMDEEAARILSQALIQSSSVRKLVLNEVKGETSAFLLNALDGDDGNRAIECLHLISVSGLGDCLRELLSSNPFLKEVKLSAIYLSPDRWRQLGQAIRENATATTICVTKSIRSGDNLEGVEQLVCAASSNVKDPTVELQITFCDYDALMSALDFVGRVLRGEIKSLKHFILFLKCSCPSGNYQRRMENIIPMDGYSGETTVLKRLKLFIQSKELVKGVWKDLLWCLRGNTNLTHLDLSRSDLDREAFRDLMGLLQVQLNLEEIDVSGTSWARDGKAAQIQDTLKQNQKRAVYMSVFREANLTFGPAKAGRLFSCGFPREGNTHGKTTLPQRVTSIVQRKSLLREKWESFWRTDDTDLDFLQNMQVSLSDFARQGNLRTPPNFLLPPTNNSCVFFFVYSSFCKPKSCLKYELEDWLCFITSSTKVTGHNLPQVLVVISHKDKSMSKSLTWAHSIVEELSERFSNFVNLHPLHECYYDLGKKKQVIHLKNHIFDIFKKLLSEQSPHVPLLCSQLTSLLVTNTNNNKSSPLWPSRKFYDFCAPSLTQFIPSSSGHANDHSRIMKAIISYLNDVGYIVFIPNLDYIIVDPNWLTNTLLDELVSLDQVFQPQEFESFENTVSCDSYTSKDGFVSYSVFARLIEEFLGKQTTLQNVDRELIENILINLDFCFKLEDTFQYFIPSFIRDHASTEDRKHVMYWKNKCETSQYVGIRIQCQDGRTMSLTAAIFP
ncbi:hypothetical protein MPTK1_8g15745 [Marchantia polymorpha subsp. ruderalis]